VRGFPKVLGGWMGSFCERIRGLEFEALMFSSDGVYESSLGKGEGWMI
jgi:hypothetical protein